MFGFFFSPAASGSSALFTLLPPHGEGLVLGPGCREVEAALRSSFIRQMSPSQAMNNRRAPSVRRHPPGPVGSLLPSVPCHGLAPAACPHQHLSFPFFFPAFPFSRARRADALSLSDSLRLLGLSLSFSVPRLPSSTTPFALPVVSERVAPNQTHKQIVGKKKKRGV